MRASNLYKNAYFNPNAEGKPYHPPIWSLELGSASTVFGHFLQKATDFKWNTLMEARPSEHPAQNVHPFPHIHQNLEIELALLRRRKVIPSQGEFQINDQGWRLSAGLHASRPILCQTCQEAFPSGIWRIFTEGFHHFGLLLIGCER